MSTQKKDRPLSKLPSPLKVHPTANGKQTTTITTEDRWEQVQKEKGSTGSKGATKMSKQRHDEDENNPAWLSKDYDEIHQKETQPLFGTGAVSLQDPESPPESSAKSKSKAGKESSSKKKQDEETKREIESGSGIANDKDDKEPSGGGGKYGSMEEGTAAAGSGSSVSSNKKDKKKKKPLTTADVLAEKDGDDNDKDDDALGKKPHVPSQNPCLWMFHLLEGITILAALCLMATQVIPLVIVLQSPGGSSFIQQIGILNLLLKIYITLFCLLFILVEIDVPAISFIRSSVLLQTYASRGLIYQFLGLICVEESYSERVKDIVQHSRDQFHVGWAPIFMQLSSWLMLSCGVIYMMLGVCCLKRLRDKMKQNEKEAWRKYKQDMKTWKELYG